MEGSMVMKALVLVVPLLAAAPVHALVLCTMPDGKKYAGDFPPAGCEVESEYENAPPRPPTADEVQAAVKSGVEEAIEDAIEESAAERDASFLASATRERRQIERELERIASRIRDLEAEIANVPVVNDGRMAALPRGPADDERRPYRAPPADRRSPRAGERRAVQVRSPDGAGEAGERRETSSVVEAA
jgi:hypothetical protein